MEKDRAPKPIFMTGLSQIEVEALRDFGSSEHVIFNGLTPRELEFVKLSCRGLTQYEIGDQLKISPNTVKGLNTRAFKKFRTDTMGEMIIKASEIGLIDSSEFVPDDLTPSFGKLTPRTRQIVKIIGEEAASNKQIAHKLKISEQSVKNHITNIYSTTELKNRNQIIIYYIEARRRARELLGSDVELSDLDIFGREYLLTKRQSEVLKLLSLSNPQIAKLLQISEQTVKNHIGRLGDKLGVRGRMSVIVEAVRVGVVGIDQLPVDFGSKLNLENLTASEKKLLEAVVNHPEAGTYKELGSILGKSEIAVKNRSYNIRNKLGVENFAQAVILYLKNRELEKDK